LHHIAKLLRRGAPQAERRTWVVKRTMAGIPVAVVLFGAFVFGPTATAGADQIGATQSQISALDAAIQTGATRVHEFTMAFDQANLNATSLAEQVSADQAQIGQLQGQAVASQTVLRQDALLSYTGAASSGLGVPSASTDPSVRAEYLQVAAGDINDAVDEYRTDERHLATAETNLNRQLQASRAAAAEAAQASQQALGLAASEQAQLDQLQGHLNQLVTAADDAAQQAAAVAAQGLPVNNGLVDVVHAIVSPPPPPPPPTAGYTDAGGEWLQLRECESGDNYAENTGNGFYGAYQFSEQTWTNLGYPGRPDLESHQMQDEAAMKLQQESGWGQWPACSAALGLN